MYKINCSRLAVQLSSTYSTWWQQTTIIFTLIPNNLLFVDILLKSYVLKIIVVYLSLSWHRPEFDLNFNHLLYL